jgi:hypothetical protein
MEIQKIPPQGNPALQSALDEILAGTMPAVAESLKTVMDEMKYGTDFNLIILFHTENENLTHEDLTHSIDLPVSQWSIHLVSYDTLTSRAKLSSYGQLLHCSWSFGIFHRSHQYKTKNSVGWPIAMNGIFGFTLQVTTTPEFHSLYDWSFHRIWLFSGPPECPEDETAMETHGAKSLYSAVKCLNYTIWAEDKHA